MSDSLITSTVTVILAVIGVAFLAVLVSPKAQTANVLRAGGGAVGGLLQAALSPLNAGGFTGSGVLPSVNFNVG